MNQPAKIFYQLTYFDTKENSRKRYLNGTSFETQERAEKEFELIMKELDKKQGYTIFSSRIKWALEAVNIEGRNKKRVLIKQLS